MSRSDAEPSDYVCNVDSRSEYIEFHDHGLDSRPSEITCCKWLVIKNETNQNNMSPVWDEVETRFSGNWLLFKPVEELDRAWSTVALATEIGKLGYQSIVRTIKDREGWEPYYKNQVICVSTYDARDEEDVWRVCEALRQLGFTAEDHEDIITQIQNSLCHRPAYLLPRRPDSSRTCLSVSGLELVRNSWEVGDWQLRLPSLFLQTFTPGFI